MLLPIVMNEILADSYFRIYDLPKIFSCVVTLYVWREVPLPKTAAYTSKFVDKSILPTEKSMGGRWKM